MKDYETKSENKTDAVCGTSKISGSDVFSAVFSAVYGDDQPGNQWETNSYFILSVLVFNNTFLCKTKLNFILMFSLFCIQFFSSTSVQ